jgi:hypothetical protein
LHSFIKLIETLGYTCLSLTYAEELIRRYKLDRVQGIPKEEVEKLFDWYNHGGYGQDSAWIKLPGSEGELCFDTVFRPYNLTRRVKYVKISPSSITPSQVLSWYVQNELNKHEQELIYRGITIEELITGLKHIEDKVRDRFGYEPCLIYFPDFSKEFKWKNLKEIKEDLKCNYYFKVFSPEMRERMLSRIELLRKVKVRLSDGSIYPLFDYLENLGDLCCVMLHGGYLFSPNPTDLDLILVEKGDAKWQRVGEEVELIFPSEADVTPQKLDAFKIGIEEAKGNNSLIIWQWGHGVCLYGENVFSIRPSDVNLFIKAKRLFEGRTAKGEDERKPLITAINRFITINLILNEIIPSPHVKEEIEALINLLENYYEGRKIPLAQLREIILDIRGEMRDKFKQVEQELIKRIQLEFLTSLLKGTF